jgi:hypothetical protein
MEKVNESDSLWAGRFGETNVEKHGPLFDSTTQLRKALHSANNLSLLKQLGDGNLSSEIIKQTATLDGEEISLGVEACMRLEDPEPATRVALNIQHENGPTDDTTYFIISENGVAVNADSMIDLPEDDPMQNLLLTAMQQSTDNLNRRIANKEYSQHRQEVDRQAQAEKEARKKRKRRQKIYKRLALVASLSVAGTGGWIGYQAWVVGPEKANQEHRAQYDAQHHVLPGEGVEISKESFSTVPNASFKDIPTYGGDDNNLDNPRRVTLDSKTACLDMKVDGNIQGKKLVAAISQESPYQAKHITASSVNDKVRVCLVESVSLSSNDPSIEVAVQLK